jgi:hypothetical protein
VKVSWDSGIPRDLGTYKLEPAMAEVILDKESENYYGYMLKVFCQPFKGQFHEMYNFLKV